MFAGFFDIGHTIIYALFVSFILSIIFVLITIRIMLKIKKVQPLRDFIQYSKAKENVPNMGGVGVILSVLCSVLLFGKLNSSYVIIPTISMILFSIIGFIDDMIKLLRATYDGMNGYLKISLQIIIASFVTYIIYCSDNVVYSGICFTNRFIIHSLILFVFFAILTMVASSNAVNITDGLDGMMIYPMIVSITTIGGLMYLIDMNIFSSISMKLYPLNGSSDILIVCAATVGALLGFLWFNIQPANIFIGDTGALGFGGMLGVIVVMAKMELLLILTGLPFVIEAASVIIERTYQLIFKKRLFKMSPIHHHLMMIGWAESKIVARMFIISLLGMIIAIFIIL